MRQNFRLKKWTFYLSPPIEVSANYRRFEEVRSVAIRPNAKLNFYLLTSTALAQLDQPNSVSWLLSAITFMPTLIRLPVRNSSAPTWWVGEPDLRLVGRKLIRPPNASAQWAPQTVRLRTVRDTFANQPVIKRIVLSKWFVCTEQFGEGAPGMSRVVVIPLKLCLVMHISSKHLVFVAIKICSPVSQWLVELFPSLRSFASLRWCTSSVIKLMMMIIMMMMEIIVE